MRLPKLRLSGLRKKQPLTCDDANPLQRLSLDELVVLAGIEAELEAYGALLAYAVHTGAKDPVARERLIDLLEKRDAMIGERVA